ncbi:MAG: formate/nitrite transporter family protein [Lachnospiraceae bacterium]|nr:formate/nitrite transporter family protein [Lachnospiraceae bacterium]
MRKRSKGAGLKKSREIGYNRYILRRKQQTARRGENHMAVKFLKVFAGAVLAGISIGLGGLVFLSVDDRVIGAALFTVGLFTVCTFGLNLFTGKVCYVFQNDGSYAAALPVIWLGNLAGTGLTALCASLTRNAPALAEKAAGLCRTKQDDSLLSLFFLGILCNIFIYIAVEGYNRNQHEAGKYLSLLFGVMVFILCGTEHCVADMFYIWMAGAWSGRMILIILVITLGNAAGGVLFPLMRQYQNS